MTILVSKEIRINIRTSEEIKRDLPVAARLRGLTVSSLVNLLAREVIRQERERDSKEFARMAKTIEAEETQNSVNEEAKPKVRKVAAETITKVTSKTKAGKKEKVA